MSDRNRNSGARQGRTQLGKRARNFSVVSSRQRQLYQLIIRQLFHDGFVDAAEELIQSSQVSVPHIARNGDRLSHLVTDGLMLNYQRAREIHDFGIEHRVENYIDMNALYVPLPSLHPGRLTMRERFTTNKLSGGGTVRCVATNRYGDLIACGGTEGIGARIFSRCEMENEMIVASAAGLTDSQFSVTTATRIAEARSLTQFSPAVETVAFQPSGEPRIVTGGRDAHLYLINFGSPQPQIELKHEDTFPVRHVCFHPSGSHLLIATDHSAPRLLSLANGRLLTPTMTNTAAVTYCDFSPDGGSFVVASADGSIKVVDSVTSCEVLNKELAHSKRPVTSALFSRSGGTILTAGMDSVARLWDIRKLNDEVASFGEPKKAESRLKACFNAAESHIWMHTSELALQCFDIYSGALISEIAQAADKHRAFASSGFDGALVTGGDDGRMSLWTPTAIGRN